MEHFSINNLNQVYATLVELGRPDLATLAVDISRRCELLGTEFRQVAEPVS
jgi:hypothetical protein